MAEAQLATQDWIHQHRMWVFFTLGMSCSGASTYKACESSEKYNSFN